MHQLQQIKQQVANVVCAQLTNIHEVDTHELGEAVDILKDLEEAMYYCMKVKCMEEEKEKQEELKKKWKSGESHYFYTMPYYPPYARDMDKDMGKMYYSPSQPRNSQGEFTSYAGGRRSFDEPMSGERYFEQEFPMNMRDSREGRSPMSRRMYMESKELHKDKQKKMEELEKYMKELGEDLVEMIEDASPEEKQLLEKKITSLASKVASLNG